MSLENLVENVKQRIAPDILMNLQQARKLSKKFAINSLCTFLVSIGILSMTSFWELAFILISAISFTLTWSSGWSYLEERDAYKKVLSNDFDHLNFLPDDIMKKYKLLPEENQQLFNIPFSSTVLEYINKQVSANGFLTYEDLIDINSKYTSENSVLINRQKFIQENSFSTSIQKENLAVLDVNIQEQYKTFNSKATL